MLLISGRRNFIVCVFTIKVQATRKHADPVNYVAFCCTVLQVSVSFIWERLNPRFLTVMRLGRLKLLHWTLAKAQDLGRSFHVAMWNWIDLKRCWVSGLFLLGACRLFGLESHMVERAWMCSKITSLHCSTRHLSIWRIQCYQRDIFLEEFGVS